MGFTNSSLVDDWLTDDGLMLIAAWARDGYSREQIALNIGIDPARLSKWSAEYSEIKEALRAGREVVDYKVENALLKSALGYVTKEIKVTIGKQTINGTTVDILKETTTKEVAPNVTACLAWLNNRRPDKWKRNRDRVYELEEEDNDLKITIVRGNKKDDEGMENVNHEVTLMQTKKDKNDIKNYCGSFELKEVLSEQFYKAMQKNISPLVLTLSGKKYKGENADNYLNKVEQEEIEEEYLIYTYKKDKGYIINSSEGGKTTTMPQDLLKLEYDKFISECAKQYKEKNRKLKPVH